MCAHRTVRAECLDYLGAELNEVDYLLWRGSLRKILSEMRSTLILLESIQQKMKVYELDDCQPPFDTYLDTLHYFNATCLDTFSNSQKWTSLIIYNQCAGNCSFPMK